LIGFARIYVNYVFSRLPSFGLLGRLHRQSARRVRSIVWMRQDRKFCEVLLTNRNGHSRISLAFCDQHYLQINDRNRGGNVNGSFGFDGSETGSDFADFLVGAPARYVQSSIQFLDSRTRYGAVYEQDSFRLRPNLTLNYGLRWEASMPWYDTQDKIETLIPGVAGSTKLADRRCYRKCRRGVRHLLVPAARQNMIGARPAVPAYHVYVSATSRQDVNV
jgi:hypothetical protein